ncbi:MAG: DUF1326 domain-containing protein [Acidimicrobiia bacterium]
MGYELEGRMAEVCTCKTFCPCTAGLSPDGDRCEFSWVFHFDRGTVEGTDVSDLNLGILGTLDGSPVDGTVRAAVFVDERSSDAQQEAILAAFTGQLGGPLADLASLIGEVVAIERVPIEFDVDKGSGSFRTGDRARARIEAHRSPDGLPTSLSNFALAPLGSTAYAAAPTDFHLDAGDIGFDFTPNSGTQFEFHHVVA